MEAARRLDDRGLPLRGRPGARARSSPAERACSTTRRRSGSRCCPLVDVPDRRQRACSGTCFGSARCSRPARSCRCARSSASSAFAVVAFSFPVLKDAVLGNVSILLMLPLAIAWRWLDRPVGSIALAVGMALRPSLGVFLGWQLLRRRWHALAWTIGAGLVLIALTLPFVGIDGYRDFVAVLANLQVPGPGSENRDLGTVLADLGGGRRRPSRSAASPASSSASARSSSRCAATPRSGSWSRSAPPCC